MKKVTIREALNLALHQEMSKNPKILIIGEEIAQNNGTHSVTTNLSKHFPKRTFDMPISEHAFTGLAVGTAMLGLKPICEFMTFNFALQSIDHILNSCLKTRYMSGNAIKQMSIVFRGPNGFAKGVGAQHTQDFAAWYGSLPGLVVLMPFSAKDHFGLLKNALRQNNPVVFLENEEIYAKEFVFEDCYDSDYVQDLKCVVEKEGKEVTLLGISLSVGLCLEAADILKEEVSVEVVNLAVIRPLDIETMQRSVEKTKRLVIVDFGWPRFGVSSEIACCLYENVGFENLKIKRLNAADCPTPYAENLEKLCYPTVEDIIKATKDLLSQ